MKEEPIKTNKRVSGMERNDVALAVCPPMSNLGLRGWMGEGKRGFWSCCVQGEGGCGIFGGSECLAQHQQKEPLSGGKIERWFLFLSPSAMCWECPVCGIGRRNSPFVEIIFGTIVTPCLRSIPRGLFHLRHSSPCHPMLVTFWQLAIAIRE